MRSAQASRNLSTPQFSTSHINRAFCRSVRSPWSLKNKVNVTFESLKFVANS